MLSEHTNVLGILNLVSFFHFEIHKNRSEGSGNKRVAMEAQCHYIYRCTCITFRTISVLCFNGFCSSIYMQLKLRKLKLDHSQSLSFAIKKIHICWKSNDCTSQKYAFYTVRYL